MHRPKQESDEQTTEFSLPNNQNFEVNEVCLHISLRWLLFRSLVFRMSCMFWGDNTHAITAIVAILWEFQQKLLPICDTNPCDALCAENNMEHKMQMWFSVCKSNNLFCILAINVFLVLKLRYPSSAPDICMNRKNVNFQCKHSHIHTVCTERVRGLPGKWRKSVSVYSFTLKLSMLTISLFFSSSSFSLPCSDCTLQTFR